MFGRRDYTLVSEGIIKSFWLYFLVSFCNLVYDFACFYSAETIMLGVNKLFEYRSNFISSGFYWSINLDADYSDLFLGDNDC